MSTARLNVFTLALNAMPYITRHLPVFQRLEIPWRWVIVHGVADPVADTAWCQRLPDHFRHDDTLAQISALSGLDSRIHIVSADRWEGKTAMCNAALAQFDKPGTLIQIDADEIWRTDQLETIPRLLAAYPQCDCAAFYCRYYIGPRRVITQPNAYGNNVGEWLRAWRWEPGREFIAHEPPCLEGQRVAISQPVTAAAGCVFNHFAYADEKSVAFKERYYRYPGAVEAWRKLNAQTGPQDVSKFLPWVRGPGVMSYELP